MTLSSLPLSQRSERVRLFMFCACLPWLVDAQQFSITSGTATSCAGVIEDSGGPAATYSNNEDHVFTICPDVPGSSVQLAWYVFDLSTEGSSIDNMTICDGDSWSAPSLGTYTGSELAGLNVTATAFNATGCLTLVFLSNSTGNGDFACGIQCVSACEHPTAQATMSETEPAMICAGGSITFDASASAPAPGHSIVSYTWLVGAQTPVDTEDPTLTYDFTQPGAFPVELIVTDETGCSSTNSVELNVQVGTFPVFDLTGVDSVACMGQQLALSGIAHPTTWAAYGANYGPGIMLPDDVGQPFESDIIVSGFLPGSQLVDAADLTSICVDMEHSFMGDLVLQAICPNGQTVILHQQGGGGTYIGGANDIDFKIPEPGECWHYCWSLEATNGTWEDNSAFGSGNTQLAGNPPNEALIPDTYESVQSFTNFIGCPLNGTWTFRSTDLWGADNGALCGWELHFDPALGGDTTTFVPVYGPGCDSTFWSGNDMIWTDAGCDSILVSPSNAGVLELTYTAIDDFGCVHDTLISIEVLPPSDPYCITLGLAAPVIGTIQVFPVPATDHVTITSPIALESFTLFDTRGRTLRTGRLRNGGGPLVISLQDLSQGMYVLELVGPDGRSRVPLFRE